MFSFSSLTTLPHPAKSTTNTGCNRFARKPCSKKVFHFPVSPLHYQYKGIDFITETQLNDEKEIEVKKRDFNIIIQ
jgi:hypothetical protein